MVLEVPRRPTVVVSNCIYCGSTNITRGVRVNQTADAGRIGISYRTGFIVWVPLTVNSKSLPARGWLNLPSWRCRPSPLPGRAPGPGGT